MIDTKFQLYQCFYFITIKAFFRQKKTIPETLDIAKIQTSHIKYSVLWQALYFVAQLSFFCFLFPKQKLGSEALRHCFSTVLPLLHNCFCTDVPYLIRVFFLRQSSKNCEKIIEFSRNSLNFLCIIIHINYDILIFYSYEIPLFSSNPLIEL